MTRLHQAPVGVVHEIQAIWLEDALQQTLATLGIALSREVFVVDSSSKETVLVAVGHRRIALSRDVAGKILV